MSDKVITQEKILNCAMEEFREKGFLNASLRNIVKNAGVTTGAFYRYYDSKEALFRAIVKPHADYLIGLFTHAIDEFKKIPDEQQTDEMLGITADYSQEMIDYIYDHYDEIKLLVECADGTEYKDFIHQLVVAEVDSTYFYLETLKKLGHETAPINRKLIHMIASGEFTGIFETIVHDMPKAEAIEYVRQMQRFYAAGWSELMGVKFEFPEE